MVFRSKIDLWLLLVLLIGAFVSLAAAVHAIRAGTGWLATTVIAAVGAALPLWLLQSTKYTISAGNLLVQSGPFRWSVPAINIVEIAPTRSPISSPALSLDRLRIEYKDASGRRKSLLVSPAEPQEFIRALEAAKNAA